MNVTPTVPGTDMRVHPYPRHDPDAVMLQVRWHRFAVDPETAYRIADQLPTAAAEASR